MFIEKAKRTGLFIIGGTHPVRVGSGIRNVAHLFSPRGNVYTQDKLHVTPNERAEYGIEPGEGLRLFETSHGRIAAVCTPSDFPFPTDGIAASSDFNSETVVICDLDLVTLEETREMGSVRPLRDRRLDIFTLEAKTPVEVIRVS